MIAIGRETRGFLALGLLLAAVLATTGATAQTDDAAPFATATPRGAWVYLGAALPGNAPYVVSRAVGDGDFAPLARVSAPADAAETAARADAFTPYFDGLPPVDAVRLWDHVVANDDVTRLMTQNLPVAHLVVGTAYLDTTVVADTVYRYRVERAGADATTRPFTYRDGTAGPAMVDLVRAGASGGAADIVWRLPTGAAPGGLIVTRRTARKGGFVRCGAVAGFYVENDTVYAAVHDPAVRADAVYEYVVTPIDPYGNPGAASAPALVSTFAETPVVSGFAAEDLGEHRVRLSWTLTGRGLERGLVLYRGDEYDGPFARLAALPPGTREYVDVLPTANENAYYRIGVGGAVDEALSAVVSAMATRVAAPLPPQSVRAEPEGAGVRVSWEGLGPHIVGYQVYRAHGGDDWRQVSGLVRSDSTAAAFVDTTSGLDGRTRFRYAVRAVGDGYGLSDLSAPASAVPAIPYDLAAPINLRSVIDGPRIRLFWDDLSAREPTLAGYDVFRRATGGSAFELVHAGGFAPRINHWIDETAVPGAAYEYAVQAYDVNSVRSVMSAPHAVGPPGAAALPSPGSLRAVAVHDGVSVSWEEVFDGRVAGYRVYRREVGGADAPLATAGRTVLDWVDTSARAGVPYIYSVAAVDSNGVESEISRPVTARRGR